MNEIAPGLRHWTARHPRIGIDVSSYFVDAERLLIDPMLPPDGVEALANTPPAAILLTNRHHVRQAPEIVAAYGCPVYVSRPGMHEFENGPLEVQAFDFGDELPGGAVAYEVGAICPDESAIHIPQARALACADGVIRGYSDSDPPGFVPDHLMDEPERVKRGLRAAYARLADLDFDNLLLAHGAPFVGDGRAALARFAAAG